MYRLFHCVAAHRSRLTTLTVGHTANQAQVALFDYVAYPTMIVWLGAVVGGAIMTAASVLFSWIVIILYRRSGRDWLGLEIARELRDDDKCDGRLARLIQAMLRRGRIASLILLSIRFDPFVAVLYLREGEPGRSGLSSKDWTVLWASACISNLYWIGVVSIALEVWTALATLVAQ